MQTNVHVDGGVRYVADDAYFWLEPGETRTVKLRLADVGEVADQAICRHIVVNALDDSRKVLTIKPVLGVAPRTFTA